MEYLQTLLSTESDFHNVQCSTMYSEYVHLHRAADLRRQQIMSLLASRSILRYNRHRLELAENKSRFQGFGLEHEEIVFPRIQMKNRPHMWIFRQGNDDCDQFYACNKQGALRSRFVLCKFRVTAIMAIYFCQLQHLQMAVLKLLFYSYFVCLFIYYYTTLVIYLFCNFYLF